MITPRVRRHSIAFQLWGMVLVAGVLLGSLIVVNTRADQSRERSLVSSQLGDRLSREAAILADEVKADGETVQTLTQVASDPAVAAGGRACEASLEALQRAIDFGYLEVIDGSGRVLCSPTASHRGSGARWAGASGLLAHIRAGKPATDGPVPDPTTGEPQLYTLVPLHTARPAALAYIGSTQQSLSPDDADKDFESLVVDERTHTIVMRFPVQKGSVGSTVTDPALLAAVKATGLTTAAGVDGVRRLYKSTRIGSSHFFLTVGTPADAAYASARHNLRRNLLFGAVLMLVMAGLGGVLQRRLARPARMLRRAIERAGQGEQVQAPTGGPSELATLGIAFNDMLAARRSHELTLAHQARHDPLTDLPNRTFVTEHLEAQIATGRTPAAVFVDLDRFKLINDAHGHAVGDEVLIAVGQHLLHAVRPEDVVGRFGGDEFVIVVPDLTAGIPAAHIAERIATALAQPLHVGARELFVSGSVGIAVHVEGEDADTVLRHADTAMYRAKQNGRNCAAVFDAAMREEAHRLLRTETDLHRALERDELRMVVQPVVDLADGQVLGAEALLRWEHPEHGVVSPLDFIPVAEETGLIVPIGAWVLREACSWAARTTEQLGRPVPVAVNVSPRQVSQPDFADVVDDALATTGLTPSLLTLEVTESLLVQDAELATETLGLLRSRGVRIALDDFGTGWSSLTYLQTLPVDEIKLDRSYVSRVPHDPTAATIVSSLIGMAHALGLSLTAEGVETAEQLWFLQSQRCEKAQGYLFQRPVAPAELTALLTTGVELPAGV